MWADVLGVLTLRGSLGMGQDPVAQTPCNMHVYSRKNYTGLYCRLYLMFRVFAEQSADQSRPCKGIGWGENWVGQASGIEQERGNGGGEKGTGENGERAGGEDAESPYLINDKHFGTAPALTGLWSAGHLPQLTQIPFSPSNTCTRSAVEPCLAGNTAVPTES